MDSKQQLKGYALVTGASSGIGATYAERLARRGHDLILVARDRTRLDTLAARLRSEAGVAVEILVADLTKKDELKRVEAKLESDARIALLINNAGAAISGRVIDSDRDALEGLIQLNTVAATRLAQAAAKAFATRGGGLIVNISSVTGLVPEMFNGVYAATKAYLLALSQSLQKEVADAGVRIQAVLPGVTRTEIWERSGRAVETLPPEMVMEVGDMVDASLAGLDLGEAVTIPSLPDIADYERYNAARLALFPNLSRSQPALRYRAGAQAHAA